MEGYDRRARVSKTQQGLWRREDGSGTVYRGRTHQKREQVTSWRDDVQGQPILSSTADPYGWLIDTTVANHRRRAIENGSLGSELPPVVDNGHPFSSTKEEFLTSVRGLNNTWWGSQNILYRGGPAYALGSVIASSDVSRAPFSFLASNGITTSTSFRGFIKPPALGDLNDFGKRAIKLTAPGQPAFDLFASLGELAFGIPRIPFSSLETLKTTWRRRGADEFLNYVFGIYPTVKDIQKLVTVMSTLNSSLEQLFRDSGRPVKRDFRPDVPKASGKGQPKLSHKGITEVFTGSQLSNHGVVAFGGIYQYGFDWTNQPISSIHTPYGATFDTTLTLRASEVKSFQGSFTYWLPKVPLNNWNLGETLEIANRIVRFTGSMSGLWQITPWSWLLDWFLDLSSSIDLLERVLDDSLVINYGYAQREVVYSAEQRTKITTPPNKTMRVSEVATTAILRKKERIRANPYGFINPTSSEMTPMRWAILAAIGINRSPRGGYN